MNIKTFTKSILVAVCITLSAPAFSNPAGPKIEATSNPGETNPKTADQLLSRLQEIKEMTTQNLSRPERKDLRKEVKEIRKELKAKQNGIYLSVGAIIIIILLLILLL